MHIPKIKIFFLSFSLLLLSVAAAYGQKSAIYLDDELTYKKAVELFEKQKYGAAKKLFDDVLATETTLSNDVNSNAEYYAAICAIKLFNDDAEYRLENFVERNGQSPKAGVAYFEMAKYQYYKKRYKTAIKWFELVDSYKLSNDDLAEFYFKFGYSYFQGEDYKNAKAMLSQVKGVDNKYQSPATYYIGHIDYTEKNYESALKGFHSLENDENFSPIVPYYITQLYFLQERYDEVVVYATPFLQKASTKRAPEIAKLIGESYFRTKRYQDAIPFLERYANEGPQMSIQDHYQLGYANYQAKQYKKAIESFEQAAGGNDELSQLVYYYIADCFLKAKDKQAARNSFRMASRMDFDEDLKEDALFNYAKLSYELSVNPFNEAIQAFEEYIKQHPRSERIDEAYQFLLSVYLTTHNYKNALESIESIQEKDEKVKSTFQRIAYFRAIELFNNLNYQAAITHFDKSMKYKKDQSLVMLAHYWKGEAYYKLSQYDSAIEAYNKYLFSPGVQNDERYTTVNYNIGYCYFKRDKYPKAIEWFRKYTSSKRKEPKKAGDAYLRIADGYFLQKDNQRAIDFYDQAVKIDAFDTDYAIFQIAVCYGLQGKHQSKVESLKALLKNFVKTRYQADAKFEIGETYLFIGENENALSYFQKVLDEHSKSSYVRKALLNIGLVKFNTGKDDEAFTYFNRVIEDYPGSTSAKEAIQKIETIYVEKGEVEKFEEYVQTHQLTDVTKEQLDKANYEQAQKKYLGGSYAEASTLFDKYLEKFPIGNYNLNANFYRAECAFMTKDFDTALEKYSYVIGRPKNTFTEKSLLKSADIHFSRENYNEAKLMFTILEEVAEIQLNLFNSRVGLMRCNFKLNDFEDANRYAQLLLSSEKVSDDIAMEAHLITAKSALAENKTGLALIEFQATEKLALNEKSAEAKFNIAYIHHLQENYEECQLQVFELVDKYAGYKEWVIKAFILLSDNYLMLEDAYQAKVTLQYIIDNAELEQYKSIAQKKLDQIELAEQEEEQGNEQEEIEIPINNEQQDLRKSDEKLEEELQDE